MSEIVSIIERAISIGREINARFKAHGEAVESLAKLESVLIELRDVFDKIKDSNVGQAHIIGIKDTLMRTENIYERCARGLSRNEKSRRGKFDLKDKFKKAVGIYKSPDILLDIQRTIEDVRNHLDITNQSLSIISRAQISAASTVISATTSTTTSTSTLGLELKEVLANTVDELVIRLKKDCQLLQEKLDRCTISIEPSFLDGLESDNPEAISFWKDHFRSAELSISSVVPYEGMYVSWARFIHELEVSFQLKNIPIATKTPYFGNIDEIRKYGNRYSIDLTGVLNLRDIRPLWLPALRHALDPLHKGYIKPYDYLSFLCGESLSNKLRKIVLDSCGYGIFVECQRTTSDISLPSKIESPLDSVGWMSACQIISVPSLDDLGIFIHEEKGTQLNLDSLIQNYAYPKHDIWVYVRYLQTGQIEKKLLSKNVRTLGGLRVGALIAIYYTLENGSNAWSEGLSIVELKACAGGRYVVTAGSEEQAIVFVTTAPAGFEGYTAQSDQRDILAELPEFDYCLLGPSTVFVQEPKVGEKIQIKANEIWYDVKVVAVDGDFVEYVDWPSTSDSIFSEENEDLSSTSYPASPATDDGYIGFGEAMLTALEKSDRRNWCPWKQDATWWDIRPYRCLHVGDLVETPVVYPQYLFHYHSLEESQLYLPARIIDVQNDQYLVEFKPSVIAYKWWPGRKSNAKEFPRKPGSKETIKNTFVDTRVMVSMDRVRPYIAGPYPVLDTLPIRPRSWSAFQGVQFTDLQRTDEHLWKQ